MGVPARSRRRDRYGRGAVAAAPVVLLVLLAVESSWSVATLGQNPLSATASVVQSGPAGSTVRFQLHADGIALALHLGVLSYSGQTVRPDHLYVFADYRFPGQFTTVLTVLGDVQRLRLYLAEAGDPVPVDSVNASQAASVLRADPHAAFAIIGLPAPDSIWSDATAFLANWVREGGLLIWAGGPLGYSSGHPIAGGFVFDGPGWQGQETLAGYNLTDSAPYLPAGATTTRPAPPLDGTDSTPLGEALGTQYYATPAGANVTQLAAHGDLSLGFTSPVGGEGGASPRASVAYLPEGLGGILFFAGADSAGYSGYVPFATGWITDGTAVLTLDIALWLALGAIPSPGPAVSQDANVPAWGSSTVTVSVPTSGPLEWVAVDRYDSVLLAYSSGTLP